VLLSAEPYHAAVAASSFTNIFRLRTL